MSHALFDALQKHFNCRTDVELSPIIKISGNHITAYRTGRQNHGPALILRIYDATGMSIERIRELLADKSPKPLSQRAILQAKYAEKKAANLLDALTAKPAKPRRESASVDDTKRVRLTVKKTSQWTSTVHRML